MGQYSGAGAGYETSILGSIRTDTFVDVKRAFIIIIIIIIIPTARIPPPIYFKTKYIHNSQL
jgi:hypothetical protein